jgi:tetratricopeptide (TPR) repeat protein
MTSAQGTVIRLSEQSATEDGKFRIRVRFGDDTEYDVDVGDPADEACEQNLAWYFEEHLRYPFLDKDRERETVEQIAAYGTALFGQVFGGEASHDYRTLRERSFDGCRLEVSGSAALHRLHWEALRDPDQPGTPLSVRLPVTRRVGAQPSKFAVRDDLPTLNILVVTARPGGPHDIGYRTISRPLLDALRTAEQPVTVDLVRPGTWDALRAQLTAASGRHGSGWYEVIHFDLHGAFTEYAPLAQGAKDGEFLPLPPFDGQGGFLFFETERDGVAHPVPAEAVASLLAEHRIPVAVLNACQSAKQTVSEAGLAQRLAEAGVPVTVGMAYSVTVTAAEQAMPVLYERLSEGADPVAAVHAARRELYEHRGRQAYFNKQLDLEDWLLPVAFGQRPLRVRLRPMNEAEQTSFYERSATVGDEPATEYGFVGRDLDIQAIERRLLADKNSGALLVRGMAGAGKTTLLRHLAWWWQRTGLVEQAFRFSYEDRAWTAHQIVREIRARLFKPAEHAAADSMPEAAQVAQVAQKLRAQRHLLVLDNAESITAAPASIPHALSGEQQGKIKSLLSALRGGRTLVLLGSRESEAWLTSDSAGPGIYPLPGLDDQAASVLVDRILARHGAARHLEDKGEREALQQLVKLLGGYPLPLTVVLPVLAASKPSEVLAELREGGPGADPIGLIRRAIEYSHGKLDESLQNSLLLLAPFTSVIMTGPALGYYQELLPQEEAVRALGEIDLAAALSQAIAVGLAAPHPHITSMVQVQPVLPYFLRSRLRDLPELRSAIEHTHYLLCCQIGRSIHAGLISGGNAQQRISSLAVCREEYANLTAALSYALQNGHPVTGLIAPLDEYLDQAQLQETRRNLLAETIANYPSPTTEDQRRELAELHDLAGSTAITQYRFEDAKKHYELALALEQALGNRRGQGITYHQLGLVAQGQRQYDQAVQNYRKALKIKLEFADRLSAGNTYGQLGQIAIIQDRMEEADKDYRQALEIFLEFGDQHRVAITYHQLGAVAQAQQKFGQANINYHQALDIFTNFGERYETADVYHQLARVAEEQGEFEQANVNYRHALDIYLEFGDRQGAARTFHNLGNITAQQQRLDEAEASYRQARDIYLEFGDRRAASIVATLRGTVLAHLGHHEEASRALLDAAVSWRQEAGQWSGEDLQWLHRERAAVGEEMFAALVRDNVPTELADELIAAIDEAGDPPDEAEPDATGEPGPRDNP